MYTIESIKEKLNDEHARWERTQKELEQQYAMQHGAYLGRVKLLEDMLEELEKVDGAKADDKQ